MAYGSILTDYLADQVDSLEVQTTWGPTILVPHPFSKSASGSEPGGASTTLAQPARAGFDLARFLQPKVIVHMTGGDDVPFTPYGEPGETKWPLLVAGASLGLTLLVLRAFRKCR